MTLTTDQKAERVLRRAWEAVEDHADQYEGADQQQRVLLTGTLIGVAFSSVVQTVGWWRALRFLAGAVKVAARYPWLNALSKEAPR